MQKAIEKKSKWFWINLMVERKLVTKEKATKLKRNLASGVVVCNPLLGLISKIELDKLIETRAIVKKTIESRTHWMISTEEIIKNGKKILTVSKRYSEWANRKRAMQGADYHNKEALDNLIAGENKEEITKEVDRLFPGNTSV